jgi:hypothetical protein
MGRPIAKNNRWVSVSPAWMTQQSGRQLVVGCWREAIAGRQHGPKSRFGFAPRVRDQQYKFR